MQRIVDTFQRHSVSDLRLCVLPSVAFSPGGGDVLPPSTICNLKFLLRLHAREDSIYGVGCRFQLQDEVHRCQLEVTHANCQIGDHGQG